MKALLQFLEKQGMGGLGDKVKQGAGKVKDFYDPSAIEQGMRGSMSLPDIARGQMSGGLGDDALKTALMRGGATAAGAGAAGYGASEMMEDDPDYLQKILAMIGG